MEDKDFFKALSLPQSSDKGKWNTVRSTVKVKDVSRTEKSKDRGRKQPETEEEEQTWRASD